MLYKSYNGIKNIFLNNFFFACDESGLSNTRIIELTEEDKDNFHNYRYNNKQISEDKIFKWCTKCGINYDYVFSTINKGKSYLDFTASE